MGVIACAEFGPRPVLQERIVTPSWRRTQRNLILGLFEVSTFTTDPFTEWSGYSRGHVSLTQSFGSFLFFFFFLNLFVITFPGKITPKYRRTLKLRGELCPQLSRVRIVSMIGAFWPSRKRQRQSRNGPPIQQAFPGQEASPRPAGVRGTMATISGGHAERGAMFCSNWKENIAEFQWAPSQRCLPFLNRRQKRWCSLLSSQLTGSVAPPPLSPGTPFSLGH